MSSIHDFDYVKLAGYDKVYCALDPAMKYYESDPRQSCMNFRYVMSTVVAEMEGITDFHTKGSLGKKMGSICHFLKDRELMSARILKEFKVVKGCADKYHHPEDYPDLKPTQDRKTFFFGFKEILDWLITLPEYFKAFIRKREEQIAEFQRKQQEERERIAAEKKAQKERDEAARRAQEQKEREAREAALRGQEAERLAAENEKQLKKLKWQKRVEKIKKILPWIGYGAATVIGSIGLGIGIGYLEDVLNES